MAVDRPVGRAGRPRRPPGPGRGYASAAATARRLRWPWHWSTSRSASSAGVTGFFVALALTRNVARSVLLSLPVFVGYGWLAWLYDWRSSWGVPNGPELALWAAVLAGIVAARTIVTFPRRDSSLTTRWLPPGDDRLSSPAARAPWGLSCQFLSTLTNSSRNAPSGSWRRTRIPTIFQDGTALCR